MKEPMLAGDIEHSGPSHDSTIVNSNTCPGFWYEPDAFKVPGIGKLFILLTTLESLFLSTFCVGSYIATTDNNLDSKYYCIIALYCTLGFYYFAVDSIYTENVFQFYCSLFISAVITTLVIFHFADKSLGQFVGNWGETVICVKSVFMVVYLSMSWPVFNAFGYRLYYAIGTNPVVHDLYRPYSVFFSLLKLDFFFGILLVMMAGMFMLQSGELYADIGAMTLSVLVLIIGWVGVTQEMGWCMRVFFCYLPAEPVYIVYQLSNGTFSPSVNFAEFAAAGAVSICVRVALAWFALRVWNNFDKGLVRLAFSKQSR